jgi:hypothetical protein
MRSLTLFAYKHFYRVTDLGRIHPASPCFNLVSFYSFSQVKNIPLTASIATRPPYTNFLLYWLFDKLIAKPAVHEFSLLLLVQLTFVKLVFGQV